MTSANSATRITLATIMNPTMKFLFLWQDLKNSLAGLLFIICHLPSLKSGYADPECQEQCHSGYCKSQSIR